MFALYFHDAQGGRVFISTLDERRSAFSLARLISRQDPRDVVVIENSATGDTAVRAVFRKGDQFPGLAPSPATVVVNSIEAHPSAGN